jgi:hypothetical protein
MGQEFALEPELAALRVHYAEIERLLARPEAELRGAAPEISGWTAEQQLAHVALANELVARNLRSLVRGSGPFVVDAGAPVAEALAVLVSGRFPRGRAQAPRMVRPPAEVRREFLVEWVAGNRRDLDELGARLDELRSAAKRVPHQLMGPLSASQWLRFAAIHTAHHLAIAREVLAAASETARERDLAPGRASPERRTT